MTTVRLLKNGVVAFPAMFEAIDRAQTSVALEMYTVADDGTAREFLARLVGAARRGVRVKVLVDAWGSWDLPDSFWDELRIAGGVVRWFHPIARGLLPFRNHRKLLLVDDRAAFIGGMNIADEYYRGAGRMAPWRDNVLEISGMEVARLRRSFRRMWSRADSPFRRFFLRLRRLRVVRRIEPGAVRFLENGPEDPMLRAGIEVGEYLPTMMHAKLVIADDTVIAGSANLDIRSGSINYELVAVVTDPVLAAAARADFEDDLKQAVSIRLEDWKNRPLIQKFKERLSYCLLARADVFFARLGIIRRRGGTFKRSAMHH